MAASQVFDTVELLESILLELPVRDVLLDQRVAKSWQQTINGSIKLQRSLFLKPMPESCKLQSWAKRPMQFLQLDTPCATVLQPTGPKTLLTSILPITKTSIPPVLHFDKSLTSKSDGDTSSWRRMLLTQPPCALEHFFSNSTNDLCLPTEESMNFHEGGRMSQRGEVILRQGTMFDLNAVRIEKQDGAMNLADVMEGLEELYGTWDTAKFNGRKQGDFGWAGVWGLHTVVKFWEDIMSVVEEML